MNNKYGKGRSNQQQSDEPIVASMWKNSYKSQKGEGTYLKLIVNEDVPAGTELIAFPRKNAKKDESHPDFLFKASEPRGAKKSAPAPKKQFTKAAPVTNSNNGNDDSGEIDF